MPGAGSPSYVRFWKSRSPLADAARAATTYTYDVRGIRITQTTRRGYAGAEDHDLFV